MIQSLFAPPMGTIDKQKRRRVELTSGTDTGSIQLSQYLSSWQKPSGIAENDVGGASIRNHKTTYVNKSLTTLYILHE